MKRLIDEFVLVRAAELADRTMKLIQNMQNPSPDDIDTHLLAENLYKSIELKAKQIADRDDFLESGGSYR